MHRAADHLVSRPIFVYTEMAVPDKGHFREIALAQRAALQKITDLLQFTGSGMCIKNEKETSAGVEWHENAGSRGRKGMRPTKKRPEVNFGGGNRA